MNDLQCQQCANYKARIGAAHRPTGFGVCEPRSEGKSKPFVIRATDVLKECTRATRKGR